MELFGKWKRTMNQNESDLILTNDLSRNQEAFRRAPAYPVLPTCTRPPKDGADEEAVMESFGFQALVRLAHPLYAGSICTQSLAQWCNGRADCAFIAHCLAWIRST